MEPKHQIPVAVIQIAFNSIYFGTVTGSNIVITIATEGFYLPYAMPLLVRIISYFKGGHRQLTGPYAMKPMVSLTVNFVGLAYLLFASITFNFPSVYQVSPENMNYMSAAIGIIMLIAVVTWLTTARKHFSGPEVEGVAATVGELGSEETNSSLDEKSSRKL